MPPGWLPSGAETLRRYDEEGQLVESSPGDQGDDAALAKTNSRFVTEAEESTSCTPFLRRNKFRDQRRRNYTVQSGGAVIYFKDQPPEEQVKFVHPTDILGHDMQPSGPGASSVPLSRGRVT